MNNNVLLNVTGLHTQSVYADIRSFIDSFTSKHTQQTYERSIRIFFMWYTGKTLEELTPDDLAIKNAKFTNYQSYLRNHDVNYSNTTINNMTAAIQSLYTFLEINEYNVKSLNLKLKSLKENPEHAGSLRADEAEQMAQLVLKQRKGQEKSALIRLAYTTSFRKSSLLSLKWDDFSFKGNYYEVKVIVKGGDVHENSIPVELYKELLKIKEQPYYQQYTDNRLFHLGNKAIQAMMDTLRAELNISETRNIVFHSFRNVAVKFGTLEEAQEQLGHSNIHTTKVSYDNETKDLSNRPSMRMHNKISDDVFKSLSKEELISLILNEDSGVLMRLKMRAVEFGNQGNDKE
ncbi:tyrosine-type recombinase/integrase [Paenibacillus sp. FSL P4-0176]|uniref:tyrosine-type recombinase/integrase n=1 Tax=Paenibacillus sp. FSL P4-0176 TaxID=2921631 RepID=UPI0030D28D84